MKELEGRIRALLARHAQLLERVDAFEVDDPMTAERVLVEVDQELERAFDAWEDAWTALKRIGS